MNNSTEPTLTLTPSSSATHITELSTEDSDFVTETIANNIPVDVWEKINTTAIALGYGPLAPLEQTITPMIMHALSSCWSDVGDYTPQGYKLTSLKLQIQFISTVSQTEIHYDIDTSATQRNISILRKTIADDEPASKETICDYPVEEIPFIIDAVRRGTISEDFPTSLLKEELEKNPDWRGEDLSELSTSHESLNVFQLNIKSTLFLESSRPDSSALPAPNETDLTLLQPQLEVQRSFHDEFSLFQRSISLRYKKEFADDTLQLASPGSGMK